MTLAQLQTKYGAPAVSPGARGPFAGALYKASEMLTAGVAAVDVVAEITGQSWRWPAIAKSETIANLPAGSFRTDLATLT